MARTWAELKELPDEELIKEHDELAKSTQVGTNYYLAELRHRNLKIYSETMLRYTKQVKLMTIVITVATIINVVVLAVGFKG